MAVWVYQRSRERRDADRALQRRMEMAEELGRAEHLVKHLVVETTDEIVRSLAREWLARSESRPRPHPTGNPGRARRGRWPVMTGDDNPRKAVPGELCPCGRQAQVVYTNPNGTEVGYCDLPDRGLDKTGPCPFCGGKWPEYGICPLYQIRPLVEGHDRDQRQDDDQDLDEHDEREEGR